MHSDMTNEVASLVLRLMGVAESYGVCCGYRESSGAAPYCTLRQGHYGPHIASLLVFAPYQAFHVWPNVPALNPPTIPPIT